MRQSGYEEDGIQMCLPQEKKKESIECNRCGQCCQAFPLGWSHAQIKANAEAARRGDYRYFYRGEEGRQDEGTVHPMMAMWADYLEPISEPEGIVLDEGYSTGLHWYRCKHLCKGVGTDDRYFCEVYHCRPDTCVRFKPVWMGGYLNSKGQIVYEECSYRKEWPKKEETQELLEKMEVLQERDFPKEVAVKDA